MDDIRHTNFLKPCLTARFARTNQGLLRQSSPVRQEQGEGESKQNPRDKTPRHHRAFMMYLPSHRLQPSCGGRRSLSVSSSSTQVVSPTKK